MFLGYLIIDNTNNIQIKQYFTSVIYLKFSHSPTAEII